MEEWRNDVPAILMAWYFGMEGGHALARVLFGDVNPSGKMPLTTPKNEAQLPPFDEFADSIEYGPYHGYTLFDTKGQEPAFPFGYGLSYTTYAYTNLKVATPTVPADGRVEVTVDVTNTGTRAGEEIVQLYVGFEGAKVERPGEAAARLQEGRPRARRDEDRAAQRRGEGAGLVQRRDEGMGDRADDLRRAGGAVVTWDRPAEGELQRGARRAACRRGHIVSGPPRGVEPLMGVPPSRSRSSFYASPNSRFRQTCCLRTAAKAPPASRSAPSYSLSR